MIIKKLLPHGFCYGVFNAYNKTIEIIKNNPNKNIYMLGWLVHNQKVIDIFKKENVIVLDDSKKSRWALINELKDVNNSILILSAHGTSYEVIELAIKKGFIIYDLTCKYVYKTHELIKNKIKEGYEILFIGKKNHPETIAILSISNKIILIENQNDLNQIEKNKQYLCTNQTTISMLKFSDLMQQIKSINKNVEFVNDICDATTIRQQAVINMDDDIDICIVVGDNKSSNTNELYQLASKKCLTYKVNDVNELNPDWFKNKKICAITAGASTPKFLIDEIINWIEAI